MSITNSCLGQINQLNFGTITNGVVGISTWTIGYIHCALALSDLVVVADAVMIVAIVVNTHI